MDKAEAFWDKSAGGYDKTEQRFEHIHTQSREKAKNHLKSSDIVLDYGCGTGVTSCALAGHVKEIQAIDISSRMLSIAKQRADEQNITNISFLQGDIFDDQYVEGSFDVILAFNMLHTVPDPQRVIKKMYALVKPGGLVVSVTPCFQDKMSLIMRVQIILVRVLCKTGLIPIAIRSMKSAELTQLFEAERFQVVDAEMIYKSVSSYFLAAKKK